ncbi:hypothetical protein VNO77_09609 [Canavalia gladiata]|uniref:Uncharacterized protein n=1 Tax=Canavalia gladiata TaxID=3824 RepID=A0AAN9MA28_CANGL
MEGWKMRRHDVAAREILQERREAIESGKLKGRRLFQSTMMEGESGIIINSNTPQREVRSMSFYTSDEDESSENNGVNDYSTHGCFYYSSSSSSSSSSLVYQHHDVMLVAHMVEILAEMRVASTIGRPRYGRTRYAVFLGAFLFVCLLLAMSISFARSSCGHHGHVILVPT